MSQTLEYGPKHQPIEIDDVPRYLRISLGAERVYPKTTTYDAAHYIGNEERITRLQLPEELRHGFEARRLLDRFASEILGIKTTRC